LTRAGGAPQLRALVVRPAMNEHIAHPLGASCYVRHFADYSRYSTHMLNDEL